MELITDIIKKNIPQDKIDEIEAYMKSTKEPLGFLSTPKNIDNISSLAKNIIKQSDIFVVIGIGGSYLGTKACIEALSKPADCQILYLGNNLSAKYMNDVMRQLEGKDITINVISKSGSTLESSVAFEIMLDYMKEKYDNDELKKRIVVTTGKGKLRELANRENYVCLDIPENIGGRFSVLTPVGLLPMAIAGLDINQLIKGSQAGENEYSNTTNICYQYASLRNQLSKEKKIEILAHFEPSMREFGEWWKQLYGESEGKENKGLFPTTANYSADLHSMGQIIQEGEGIWFETFINFEDIGEDYLVSLSTGSLELSCGLNHINKQAFLATRQAHEEGGVPTIVLSVPKLDEYHLGKLIYFFMKSCVISARLLGVNPLDQPGVENYKSKMFELLERA